MRWFTNDGQAQGGPYEEAQVVHLVRIGQLRGGHVAPEGGQWIPLGAHPPFAQALQESAAPAPKATAAMSAVDLPFAVKAGAPPPSGQPTPGLNATVAANPGAANPIAPGGSHAGALAAARGGGPPPGRSGPVLSTPVMLGIAAVAIVILPAIGLVIWKLASGPPDKMGAKVAKVSTLEDEKVVEVDVELTVEGAKNPTVVARLNNETLKAVGTEVAFDEGKATRRWDIASYEPGEYTLTLTVDGEGSEPVDIDAKVTKRPRLVPLAGGLACKGRECLAKVDGDFVVMSAPPGTSLRVGTKSFDATGQQQLGRINYLGKLSGIPIEELFKRKLTVDVGFTFADGLSLRGNLAVPHKAVSKYLKKRLEVVRTTKVVFGASDVAPKKPRSVVVFVGDVGEVYGTGNGVEGLDLVGFKTYRIRRGSCGSYRKRNSPDLIQIGKTMHDATIEVYDRRQGKLVAKKRLGSESPRCPTTLDEGTEVKGYPPKADVDAFLNSLIE